MAGLSQDEQNELEQYIRDNFTQEDFAGFLLVAAKLLKISIGGLTLKEAWGKITEALNNMGNDEFNQKLVNVLMQRGTIKVDIIRPRQYISPNTKASNRLFARENERYYEGIRQLAVEGTRSKKDISVSLFVKYDEHIDAGIRLSMPHESSMLISFDRIIHDAIVSQIMNGNRDISTNMIFQVISGNSDGKASANPVSKSLSKAISDSITRLFLSWVEIDATEQAKAYGFDKGRYSGHLLTGSITEASLNGNITTCAHIAELPILYKYANDCGQVIRYDVKLLDVPALENSPEWIVLKTYLLQQVQIMTRNKNYSRTICFETLHELLDVQAPSEAALRMKKKQIRDNVIKCLDFWTAQKLIRGYKLNKHGKSYVSVTLRVKLSSISAKL